MQKGARLADDLTTVTGHLDGSEGALAELRQAARRLDRIAHEHPLLGEALAALDRAVIEASEGQEKLEAALRALRFDPDRLETRSEEHTSELQSLMRISYAVFCLKKKNTHIKHTQVASRQQQ